MSRYRELKNNKYIGLKFGRLTVNKALRDTVDRVTFADCSCECGRESFIVRLYDLPRGHTMSCGCLRSELARNMQQNYMREFKEWRLSHDKKTSRRAEKA